MIDLKTRMNNEIREAIVANAMETSGVLKEEKKLIDDRAEYAEKVRLICIETSGLTDKELRKFYQNCSLESGAAKYSDFIYTSVSVNSKSFDVAINGQVRTLYLDGATSRYQDTHIEIKSAYEGGPICPRNRYLLSSNELLDEISELDKRAVELKNKRETLQATVSAAVRKAGTIKTLLDSWPEAKELLPKNYQASLSKALALNPKELNALCGIPKSE